MAEMPPLVTRDFACEKIRSSLPMDISARPITGLTRLVRAEQGRESFVFVIQDESLAWILKRGRAAAWE